MNMGGALGTTGKGGQASGHYKGSGLGIMGTIGFTR